VLNQMDKSEFVLFEMDKSEFVLFGMNKMQSPNLENFVHLKLWHFIWKHCWLRVEK
jgi:hypothetical protein